MIVVFSFLCLLINVTSVCYAQELAKSANSWCYQGKEFTIEVKKTGDVHSLNTHEVNKILGMLRAIEASEETREFLEKNIFAFINAQIVSEPLIIDATNVRCKKYRFRLFDICKEGVIHKATRQHSEQVAAWLEQQGMQRHSEKERIKIVNHGTYLSLRTKKIERYKKIIPQNEDRQSLLKNNKLIAVFSVAEESEEATNIKDVTDKYIQEKALSKATLNLRVSRIQKNN